MNISGQRILIFGDSLSHPGADTGPTIVDISPKTVLSSVPGEHLAQRLRERGASSVRINARVGRSAANFYSREDYNTLLASDRQWQPTKVIIWLGTNDIDYSKSPTGLAMTRTAMMKIRDAYRGMGAEVIAIGPPTYLNASYNNASPAMYEVMRGVFGNDKTIDARPLTYDTSRASDGVHFTPSAAKLASFNLADAIARQQSASVKPVTSASSSATAKKVAIGVAAIGGIAGLSVIALQIAKHAAGASYR